MIGLVVIAVGVVLVLDQDPDDGSTLGGLIIRVGAVLGAVALVLPTIRKPSLPTLIVAGLGLILVLARPGLVWAALIGWAVWVLLGRQREEVEQRPRKPSPGLTRTDSPGLWASEGSPGPKFTAGMPAEESWATSVQPCFPARRPRALDQGPEQRVIDIDRPCRAEVGHLDPIGGGAHLVRRPSAWSGERSGAKR